MSRKKTKDINIKDVEIKKEETDVETEFVCENCGGPLTSFVVSNGRRFCSDNCMYEYLSK